MVRRKKNMNIGIEMVASLLTTAVGIGITYATLKVKIDTLEKNAAEYPGKEYLLQLHKESTDEQKQLSDRIAHEQGVYTDMQKDLRTLREDHSTRIARSEEAMAYSKQRVEEEQKTLADRIDQIQKSMTSIREDHGSRIARLEEAMLSIKQSIASIDTKIDRLLLK
jgi:predicted  nucleic acid-binding Zn-ribbon protein